MSARLLGGDRRVWIAAGGVLAIMFVLVLAGMSQGREPFTGSNAVFPRDAFAVVQPEQRMCVTRMRVPSGTGRVRLAIDTQTATQPAWTLTARLWETHEQRGTRGRTLVARRAPTRTVGFNRVDFLLDRDVPVQDGGYAMADICLRSEGGSQWFPWGRTQLGIADRPLQISGQDPVPARLSLWYLSRDESERSMLSQLPDVFSRASLFRPAPIGPWSFWVVFALVLPGLCFAGVRLLARERAREADGASPAATRGRLPAGSAVALIAFGVAACWTVTTPAFQTPDESEHFAAVQYFAETGRAVDAASLPQRPVPWSSQELVALDAARQQTSFERQDSPLPWLASYEQAFVERSLPAGRRLPTDNGGGFHPATSSHTPLYYALATPAYLLAQGRGVFTQLMAVRLFDGLLGALVALLAFATVRELAPRRRGLAVAAGLLVAFQPMFSFMSGAVNNDAGVNAVAAALVYLVVRGLRRGISWRLALGLGALVALAPLMKGTAYALYPPLALAIVFMLARRWREPRGLALAALALGAGFLAIYLGWDRLAGGFERTTYATPGGGAPTGVAGLQDLRGVLSWWWQIFVPLRLPFMTDFTVLKWPFYDIYIREGFGAFGWYAIKFPEWVYITIVFAGAAVAVLGLRAVWERRGALLDRGPELLFLLLVPVAVLFAVEAAYYTVADLPLDGSPEQGRYAFPSIAAVAALVALACLGAGRRHATTVAAMLVAALMGMTIGGQLLQLQSFYT